MTNKKLYLIGDPVDHSLSPLLHGAMIAQTGVHYTYEVRRVQPRDLADFVAEAKAGGCAGFNVTMPHKEAILPLLDELSRDVTSLLPVRQKVRMTGLSVVPAVSTDMLQL